MSRNNNLPFPIGSTYSDGGPVSSTAGANLEGKVYRVDGNPSADGGHQTRFYKIVRNVSGGLIGGPIGGTGTGQRPLAYGTGADQWNRQIAGVCQSLTSYAVVPDDSLTSPVQNGDLFYVHVEGPARVQVASKVTGSVAFAAGKAVAGGRTGGLARQILTADGTAERHPFGTIYEAITAGVTGNRSTVVYIGGLNIAMT